MKKLTKIYCTLVVIICTLFVGIYAWTTRVDFLDINNVTISSTSGYYESGKGTEDDPFIISRPKHLYNLAWLQDLGFYDDDQYYFELKNDIDMENLWIPPIGTQDHPFIGNFNGNGKLINNVRVGTNTLRLGEKFDANDIKGVGLFGFISDNGATDTFKKIGNVSNFTISDIYVECALSNQYSGLIAGNVEANLSNVGVYTGRISYLGTADNQIVPKSEYTLIGYVNENKVDWEDKPESASGNNLIIRGSELFDANSNFELADDAYHVIPNASAVIVGQIKSTQKGVEDIKYANVSENNEIVEKVDLTADEFNSMPSEIQTIWSTVKGGKTYQTVAMRPRASLLDSNNLSQFELNYGINNDFLDIDAGYVFPKGTIWFRPRMLGKCFMVFVNNNKDVACEMSIFKMTNNDGLHLSLEYSFECDPLDGRTALVCEFDITEFGDYVIGSTSSEAGFFIYLELVGAGENGGELSEKILNVDFVPSPTTIIDSNYTNELKSNVLIKIALINSEELLQANVVLYFKRNDDGTEVNYQINGIGISIQNVGTGNLVVSETLITSGVFPPVT